MNHPYMIALEEYSPLGAPNGVMTYVYKDNAVDFAHAVAAYARMTQTTTDEEGNTVNTTMKKYKVTPQILCYVSVDSMEDFKRINGITI